MTNVGTVGSRLLALKERAGMSLAQIARAAGYQGASSIQKLFKADYDPENLQSSVAERLAMALEGYGDPAIKKFEILALAGEGVELERLVSDAQHLSYIASAYIGIHRTRRIEKTVEMESGDLIPLFIRENMSAGIPVHPCPSYLRPRGIIGLYMSVGNMWPRFEEGEPIFYEFKKPPSRGDDVIITLGSSDLEGRGMIVGRLRLMTDDEIHLDQLSPVGIVKLKRVEVCGINRVMHTTDFLEPLSYAT